jgi:hypothetical protein
VSVANAGALGESAVSGLSCPVGRRTRRTICRWVGEVRLTAVRVQATDRAGASLFPATSVPDFWIRGWASRLPRRNLIAGGPRDKPVSGEKPEIGVSVRTAALSPRRTSDESDPRGRVNTRFGPAGNL